MYGLTYSSPFELNLSHIPSYQLKNAHYPKHLHVAGLGKLSNLIKTMNNYNTPLVRLLGVAGFISVSRFRSRKPRSYTGPTELKTLTPWMLLEMVIYLVLLMCRFSTGISIARKEGSVAK